MGSRTRDPLDYFDRENIVTVALERGCNAVAGTNNFEESVTTAVINKRAGGTGLINDRKAFHRPRVEGIRLLTLIQDVYLSEEITVA